VALQPVAWEYLFPQAQRRVAAAQSGASDVLPVTPRSALPPDAVKRRASDPLTVRWLDARVRRQHRSPPEQWLPGAAESVPQVSPPLERLPRALEQVAARS
jgi:hypothetical protein